MLRIKKGKKLIDQSRPASKGIFQLIMNLSSSCLVALPPQLAIPTTSTLESLYLIGLIVLCLGRPLLSQKFRHQCSPSRDSLPWIELQTKFQEVDALHHIRLDLLSLVRFHGRDRPLYNLLQGVPLVAYGGQGAFEHGAVLQGTIPHLLLSEDRSDLDQRVDVVCGVEKRETLAEDGEKNDADGPDVDLGRLRSAFQEHLGSPETPGTGSVGPAGGPLVVLGIAGRWCLAGRFAVFDLESSALGAVLAKTMAAFRSFALASSESLCQGEC